MKAPELERRLAAVFAANHLPRPCSLSVHKKQHGSSQVVNRDRRTLPSPNLPMADCAVYDFVGRPSFGPFLASAFSPASRQHSWTGSA